MLVSLSRGAQRELVLGADHPERVGAAVFVCPVVPLGGRPAGPDLPEERGARHRRRLGEVQPALLAPRLRGLRRVLHLADLHGAALDEADRGRRRLGPRNESRDAGRDAGGRLDPDGARDLAARLCPVLVIQGSDDAITGPVAGWRWPRPRAATWSRSRARATPARARPGQGQPAAARLRRPAAPAGALGPRQVAPQAGALHLVADRPRPRPPRRRDRQGAA